MAARDSRRHELWTRLLSSERLYGNTYPTDENSRSEFQKDYDRIIFSSSFRRLQDKTQVFPLSQTDFTRTRLTHTLEASAVGRTLGVLAAKHLNDSGATCDAPEVGTIVATATLAHDLGNPPFGHSGESAIQTWASRRLPQVNAVSDTPSAPNARARRKDARSIAMRREELSDFHEFEGNAQGFRILTRTAMRERKGGLRPTLATMGAMAKYPRPSMLPENTSWNGTVAEKKPGYFQNDRVMALKAFRGLGMAERAPGIFSRHPLAFLTEAADDICYAVADIEDALKLGVVTFQEVSEVLRPLAEKGPMYADKDYLPESARLGMMRSSAVGAMVAACMEVFRGNLQKIEEGKLGVSLVELSRVSKEYESLKFLAQQKAYKNERVLQIEYAGYQTIGGLLDMFYSALCEQDGGKKEQKLRSLFPIHFLRRPFNRGFSAIEKKEPAAFYLSLMTRYERLLAVTDYVSGMTDRFAVQLFQRLSGIRLPE